jgi:hypothetical protein
MQDVLVYVIVFAVAGGFLLWLRRIGRRGAARLQARPRAPHLAAMAESGDEIAENLGFAAEKISGLAGRRGGRGRDDGGDGPPGKTPDVDGGASDGGGGGGGGGDGG